MHTNHRRKKPRSTKRHGPRGRGCVIYSAKWYRRQKAHDRRARDRTLLETGRWDDFVTHYPKTIYWDFF